VTRLEIRGQKQLEFLHITGHVDTGKNENNCGGDSVVRKRCIALRKRGRQKERINKGTRKYCKRDEEYEE
jgi:hypothetical protein